MQESFSGTRWARLGASFGLLRRCPGFSERLCGCARLFRSLAPPTKRIGRSLPITFHQSLFTFHFPSRRTFSFFSSRSSFKRRSSEPNCFWSPAVPGKHPSLLLAESLGGVESLIEHRSSCARLRFRPSSLSVLVLHVIPCCGFKSRPRNH